MDTRCRTRVLLKAAALVGWATRNGIGVFIGERSTRSLISYAQLALRSEVADGLAGLTERGEIGWGTYARLRELHRVRDAEFIAAVVQHKYVHQQGPFLLRRASDIERDLLHPLQVLSGSGSPHA